MTGTPTFRCDLMLQPRTPTQRLQDAVNVHDMSMQQLVILFRDVVHEVHIRMDGMTPGADDVAHNNYHRRQQDKEIQQQQQRELRSAQYWAGLRIGGTILGVLCAAAGLYTLYTLVTR